MSALFVREVGSGPAVLLLGGSPTPAEHLMPLAERLSHRRRVLLPDLPGYGRSPMPEGPYTLARAQTMLEDALAARGIDATAVVGLSLGAYRSFALARSARVRVTHVVSLGGFAGLDADVADGMRQLAAAVRSRAELGDLFVARMLSPAFAARHPAVAATVKTWLALLPPTGLAAELDATADAADLRPELATLRAPILARVGRLDVATPPAFTEAIARAAPRTTVQLVDDCGHLLLLEDAAATIDAVEAALG
jgi:pimeloyl-ACP methyl ester carboxylesterase